MIQKLLARLKTLLFRKPVQYIKVAATNQYLKIKGKIAELVSKHKVPQQHRSQSEQGDDSRLPFAEQSESQRKAFQTTNDRLGRRTRPSRPRLPDEGLRAGRANTLSDLHTEEVGRRANRNVHVRTDVLDNPELIDADSEWEAELKLKLARGEDITEEIEANPHLDLDTVLNQLGLEWAARAGKNAMGTQFVDALNGDTATDADSTGEAGTGTQSGDVADASETGYTSARADGPLHGVSTVDIDTDASTVSPRSSSTATTSGSPSTSVETGSSSVSSATSAVSGGDGVGGDVGGGSIGADLGSMSGTGTGGGEGG